MTNTSLRRLPKGWFHHEAHVLALLEQHRPAVVVELGTYLGASAIAMARVLALWHGVIYCVDTWSGVPKGRWRRPPLRVFECAHNLMAAGVGASVRLIPATTLEAAAHWTGPPIDLLYVDADHSFGGVMADLEEWSPHLRAGGLLVGDDYGHPRYPGVKLAWDSFEAQHGLTFQRVLTPNTNPPGMRVVYGAWRL